MLAAMVAFVLACTPKEQPKPDSSKDATETPSQEPSANPSDEPSDEPSAEPSDEPSVEPTESEDPSSEPGEPSVEPEDPSVEPSPITIDGDMSDWADIEGAVLTPTGDEGAEGALALEEVKACADANNVYVYVKRSKRHGRWTALFNGSSNSGYYYYDFDLDNNPETGDKAEHSNGNYEAWCYIYHFYGSSTEPTVKESDMKGGFEGMTSAGIVSKGAFTEDSIEVETAFPRSCLPEFSSESFAVSVWGNKDANPFTKTEGIVY